MVYCFNKFLPRHSEKMDGATADSLAESASRVFTVQAPSGLHARPAAMIVRIANRYEAEIVVEKDDGQTSARSIMGLMMLAAGKGAELRFLASGKDAQKALDDLAGFFDRKFADAYYYSEKNRMDI